MFNSPGLRYLITLSIFGVVAGTALSNSIALPQADQQTTTQTILNEDFESGNFSEGWKLNGYVAVTDRAPAHTGKYSAILGADYSPPVGLAGSFSLEKRLKVNSGSRLSARFWFKAHNLFGGATAFRDMQFTFSLAQEGGGVLWTDSLQGPWDSLETWTLREKTEITVQSSDVTLKFAGKGGGVNLPGGVGGILLDDILVTQTTTPTSPTTTRTTQQLTTSKSQVASSQSSTPASEQEPTNSPLPFVLPPFAVVIIAGGVTLSVIAVVGYSRASKRRYTPMKPPKPSASPFEAKARYTKYLQRLEELRAAGEITEDSYQRVKAEYLRNLEKR